MDEPGSAQASDQLPVQPGLSKVGREMAPGVSSLLMLGIAGAVLAWFVIEKYYPPFQVSPELQAKRVNSNAVLSDAELQEIRQVDFGNSVFAAAIVGLTLGSMMGTGEGIARRSLALVLLGFGCGALFGTAFGSLGGLGGHFLYERTLRAESEISGTLSIAMHAITLGFTSFGIGLGLGIPSLRISRIVQSTLKATIGGLCAGMIYFPLAAAALPLANSDRNIPVGSANRLLWTCTAALVTGLIVTGLRPRPSAKPQTPAVP